MAKTPTYIVTGFLGSGKTTLVKKLLSEYGHDKKLAVVQNEFAPQNFDGQELKRHTNREFDLLEVNNGSVFCVCLLSGFISSFTKFVNEYSPDIILFEASGLSDPIGVGELFNAPQLQSKVYLAGTICIVDALNFLKIEKLQQRLVHQVQIAHSIILNKTDLEPNYQPVIDRIKSLNPQSEILPSSYCNVIIDELIAERESKTLPRIFAMANESDGRPDINSVVYRSSKGIRKEKSQQFLNELAKAMIRIKGYLLLDNGEVLAVQFAGGNLTAEKIKRSIKQTELIAMGYEMTPGDFKLNYQEYCK